MPLICSKAKANQFEALFVGWNGLDQNPPSHNPPDDWNGRNDSDPFKDTQPPFGDKDDLLTKFSLSLFWRVAGRPSDEL